MAELFPDFIKSSDTFFRAKAFWRDLAREQATVLGQQNEWAQWAHEDEWSDDPEFMDGAVVFTCYSASQHKGFRVQQSALCAGPEKKPHVCPFMDMAGEGILERPIPNLFIGTIPMDENLALIRRLIHHWFRKDVDFDAMHRFLEEEGYKLKG